jgi:hypothetical protein
MELQTVPTWLGAAIVAAAFAAIGYVAKVFFEWAGTVFNERRQRRARLVALQSLLRGTRASFQIQFEHVERLKTMVEKNHAESARQEEGYDRFLSRTHGQFNREELELYGFIRSITVNSLCPGNRSMIEWLKADAYFKAQRRGRYGKLAKRLADLDTHLLLWSAKYAAWIPDNPEHCLVYMADEEAHGIGFPHGIDGLIDDLIGNGKKKPRQWPDSCKNLSCDNPRPIE